MGMRVIVRVVMAMRRVVVVLMAVVPQFGFVQQKEENQANEQRQKQVVRLHLALKCLGQQVHKGRGHQGTGSQAQHVLGIPGQRAKAQGRRQPHRTDAGKQGSYQNCYQSHSFLRTFYGRHSPIHQKKINAQLTQSKLAELSYG